MPARRCPRRAAPFRVLAAVLVAVAALIVVASADAQTGGDLKLAVEPSAIDIAPGGVANVTLVLHNPTTRSLTLELGWQAQNATPAVNVSFAEHQVTLPPNETHRVRATVKVLPRALPGEQSILLGAHEPTTGPTATRATNTSPLASGTTRLLVRVVPTPIKSAAPTAAPSPAPSPAPPDAPQSVTQAGLVIVGGAAVVAGGAWSVSWLRRRGGWLALVAPLYSRLAPHKILDQPTRKAFADLVQREPGVTFGEAQRKLGIGAGALTHHARMLEQAGVLFSSPDGQTRRFFPVGGGYVAPVAPLDERVLEELRREPATLTTLAHRLGVSKQALHYHVKRLMASGHVVAREESSLSVLRVAPSSESPRA